MLAMLDDSNYLARFTGTKGGICLFFKQYCPHCKNMEKVLEKFAVLEPQAVLLGIDLEKSPEAARRLGITRAPTLVLLKNGEVAAQKAGLMNPKETLAFYRAR